MKNGLNTCSACAKSIGGKGSMTIEVDVANGVLLIVACDACRKPGFSFDSIIATSIVAIDFGSVTNISTDIAPGVTFVRDVKAMV